MSRTALNRIVSVLLAVTFIVIVPRMVEQVIDTNDTGENLEQSEPTPAPEAPEIQFQAVPSSVAAVFPPDMARMLADGEHGKLREHLTNQAGRFVRQRDEAALARTLSLLGESSVEAGDLEVAEKYFLEALDIYTARSDVLGIAGVEMSLGLVNLDKRRRAVAAGTSYDRLLLARWKVSHGQYFEAEQEIEQIIRTELQLDRFDAAANAYGTLFQLFRDSGDDLRAQQAVSEALRLYARVGNASRAQSLLNAFSRTDIDPTTVASMQQEFDENISRFRKTRHQLAAADDYQQLYRHYMATGDSVRAWRLREKAAEITRVLPPDVQIRRRSDSLVMLYSSNDAVRRARSYLTDAGRIYEQQGKPLMRQRTRDYLDQIK